MNSLTIITVCFNAAQTLKRCLTSIASQRATNFNHIIIDGASDDGTINILNEFGYRNHSVKALHSDNKRVFISEMDKGIYFAMNKGLDLITTSHCMFLNADDHLYDEFATLRIISNLEAKHMSVFAIQYIEGRYTRKFFPTKVNISDILYDRSLRRCPHPTTVFPSSDIRFNTQYKYAADYLFVLENLKKYGQIKKSRSLVTTMYRSEKQLSYTNRNEMKSETQHIVKHFDDDARLNLSLCFWLIRNSLAIIQKYIR